jgi:putative FmdB family regulatory protein
MPTYEYLCKACKKEFSLIQSFSEHEKGKVACPKCKSKQVKQLISLFMAKTSRAQGRVIMRLENHIPRFQIVCRLFS